METRPNTLRVVYNIADVLENVELAVKLKPEHIPGASIHNDEDIRKLNVNQLKFWLKCRRVKRGGIRKELLER